MHGTAAEKLTYDVYEENKVLSAKRKQRSNNKVKFRAVCTVLFVFTLGIIVIYRYALLTELNYNIGKQTRIYNDIKNGNIQLKAEIQNGMDLNKVREIAENKLGMQKPDKYQIVYIRVPKTDVTKVAEANNSAGTPNNGIISMFMDKAGKITGMLY